MESILGHLYMGNIHPAERGYSCSPEGKKRMNEFLKKQTAFRAMLSPELLALSDEVSDANYALIGEDYKTSFIDGFRLGALTMLEVLLGEEGFCPWNK